MGNQLQLHLMEPEELRGISGQCQTYHEMGLLPYEAVLFPSLDVKGKDVILRGKGRVGKSRV